MDCRSVRTRAASALGKLSALSTRVDPLVSDLLSMLQVFRVLPFILVLWGVGWSCHHLCISNFTFFSVRG
jgi:hypothetical protein